MKSIKILNLTLKSIMLVALAFFIGSFGAVAVGAPLAANAVGTVFALATFIPKGDLKGSFLTITAADIVTEWGALFRDQGQTKNDIISILRTKSETEAIFKRRVTKNTVMEKASAEFARVLQRFQKGWTPIGGVTFLPEKINLYRLKIDAQETPDDLVETWLGFLTDGNLDRKEWPFSKWWVAELIKQANADFEKFEIFGGVPGTITPGTATAAGTNVLGIKKQLNDGHAAGSTRTLTMGAVPTDPVLFVKYIEDMNALAQSSNEELFQEIDQWNMSKALMRRFQTGMRTKYNMNYDQTPLLTVIDSDVKIVGLNSHSGSTKIWATPAWNRECGIKDPGNENIMRLENVDRTIKAYTDYHKGVGFWIDNYIYQNDVELV